MRFWMALLSLVVASAMVASTPAQEKKEGKRPHMTVKERFEKADTNHDSALSEEEFVAAHPRLGDKAKDVFKKMGGTAEKGLSFEQYQKGMEQMMKGRKKRDSQKQENK